MFEKWGKMVGTGLGKGWGGVREGFEAGLGEGYRQ